MPQINAAISHEAYRAAKESADKAGMLMRKWFERAILEQAEREAAAPRKERTYECIND